MSVPVAVLTGAPVSSDTSATTSLSVSFALAADQWRAFGLDARRDAIDALALGISDEEERSAAARRSLAECTRGLKAKDERGKLAALGATLKQYQEEINALTRRCLKAEAAFLQLYAGLISAVDPAPLLSVAAQQESELAQSQQSMQSLRSEIAEFAALKDQSATLRRLENENRIHEQKLEVAVTNARAEAEAQLAAKIEAATEDARHREMELQARFDALAASHTDRQREWEHQRAQLLQAAEKSDTAVRVTERENDTLRLELERLTQQLEHQWQRQHHQHITANTGSANRHELTDTASITAEGESHRASELLEVETEELRREVARLTDSKHDTERALDLRDHELRTLSEDLETLRRSHAALVLERASLPSVAEYLALQSRVRMLSALHDVNDEETANIDIDASAVLRAEARKLEAELTRTKVALTDANLRFQQLEARVRASEAECAQHAELIQRLEKDLSAAQALLGHTDDHASGEHQPPHHQPQPQGEAEGNGCEEGRASAIASVSSSASIAVDMDSSQSAAEPGAPSLLSIVVGQRDRLRARVDDLERAFSDARTEIDELRRTCRDRQAESLQLYEKLQYVKSLHAGSANGATAPSSESERKYAALYEERLNPFSEFKRRNLSERERALPATDRLALTLFKLVSSKKAARTVAFAYALALHLLVAAVLLTHTAYDHCPEPERHYAAIGGHR